MAKQQSSEKLSTSEKLSIAIIGGGIVGVSTALYLQRAGHDVTIFDKVGVAEGASSGNGGILAASSIVPITTPGLLKQLPGMVLNPNEPLFLKWRYLPKLTPWLIRFLSHANHRDAMRTAASLNPIIGNALQDHQALAAGTRAERWLVPSDYLYVYKSRRHFEADAFTWNLRREHGFEWSEMDAEAVQNYDPNVSDSHQFAVCLSKHGYITSPADYVKDLAAEFEAKGGRVIIADVEDIASNAGQVVGVRAGGDIHRADRVVLTAGIWSGRLAKKFGLSLPLETERGYHVELWEPNFMPRAPLMVASRRFVITPMQGRIRLAGIVELGGINAAPSKAPIKLLIRNIIEIMPGLRWKETTNWIGFRPSLSDSTPIISEVEAIKGLFMGFGHHHVGLTGGPKTGQILALMAQGMTPNTDISPYSVKRFAKKNAKGFNTSQ